MRALAFVAIMLLATVASGGVLEVSPGPGTPLQDAVGAASPGDKILVHAGQYFETLVVDKAVAIYGEGQVEVGPELGALASSCVPQAILEITANDVRIQGGRGRNDVFAFQGGSGAAIRVHDRGGITLRNVRGHSFCAGASGLDLARVARLKIKGGYFVSYSPSSAQAAPACRLSQIAGGRVDLKGVICNGYIAPGGNDAGAGLLIEDVTTTGAFAVLVTRGIFQSHGDTPVALVGATGVRFSKSMLLGTPSILGEPIDSSITVDATSTGNLIQASTLQGPVLDVGGGNCFRRNVDENGVALPDDCS